MLLLLLSLLSSLILLLTPARETASSAQQNWHDSSMLADVFVQDFFYNFFVEGYLHLGTHRYAVYQSFRIDARDLYRRLTYVLL